MIKTIATRAVLPVLLAGGCALALTSAAVARTGRETSSGAVTAPDGSGTPAALVDASATLEACVTSVLQSERSATFAGEMTAVPGTARMQISVELLERVPGEMQYRSVSAPGLGTWRSSGAGVKIYTYIHQVTDLAAPAFYRGEVRFRWLDARGRAIKTEQLRTTRCEQPAGSETGAGTAPGSTPGAAPGSQPGGASSSEAGADGSS